MDLDDYINRLEAAIKSIEAELPNISEEIAMTTMGIVVDRIQKEGIEGKTYSKNKLPAFFFHGRALNKSGRDLDEKHSEKRMRKILKGKGEKLRANNAIDKMEDGISYKEWREANGLQTAFVDLTFSGRMFQNLGIIGTVKTGDSYVTIIGGFDKEVKDKLKWNAERFGDFMATNDQENEELTTIYKNRIVSILKRFGL